MLPRTPYAQGAVSGLSAAVGYLLGTLAGYGVGAVLRRVGRIPAPRAGRLGWLVLGVAGSGRGRRARGVARVAEPAARPGRHGPPVGGRAGPDGRGHLVVFGLLFLVSRLVSHGVWTLDRLLARRLPRALAHAVTAAVFVSPPCW